MGKRLLIIVVVIFALGLSLNIGFYFFFPDVASLARKNPPKTAFMEYREKEWQREGKQKKIRQQWVPLTQISPYVIKAVIIAEDDKFWGHEGFDFEAMQKALEKDLQKGKIKAGGSTISQQLAKNLYLSPAKNPVRKLKEAILTWRIERYLSKKRIIELYLNVVEWGDGIFGIEMAARTHFGKRAADINAQEAARLAAVLPNPRKYNPQSAARYVVARSERIYRIMVKRGIVIPEYDDVMKDRSDLGVLLENQDPEAMKKLEQQIEVWKKESAAAAGKTAPPAPEEMQDKVDRD
ncbi:MAG TPA: monofunctional biosynthetic peptidoglycan transglycosylase [Syntrophales bacterium]|nr:monofunctional biosynthetic peptidoglycan transglycosylase [Syntrophales bacterium]HON22465.1 monofunctional biosynthetic peptidoglycan transglycosylase [Syntrophales bacterium]HOU78276.1 monofunctional biosynthetic peptidoglycan transglycosylase [Syntrophales bacterium]HPC33191.1 monofunctional biosynthetic peptidoglycan transglycosylase [Syntrophales bacterium]HQG34559.1 monofunctional biosynthetic peptidoglycan transglycosylase [Syntrophales bacterium]